ncbi:MAG: hypothetical protein AAFZ80_10100 [Cyanobacteria bacterium P01_A01_bin.105]
MTMPDFTKRWPHSRLWAAAGLGGVLSAGCQLSLAVDAADPVDQGPLPVSFESFPVQTLQGAVDRSFSPAIVNAIHRQPRHPLEQSTVSVAGLGPIQLGMTVPEASAASGVEFAIAPGDQDQACQYHLPATDVTEAPPDGSVGSLQDPGNSLEGLGLMVIEDRIIRIDIWPGSPISTVSGVQIGSTEAEIKALYPGQIEEFPHAYTDGKYLTYTSNEDGRNLYRIVFETSASGEVTQYRTGQFPAVIWLEGCS